MTTGDNAATGHNGKFAARQMASVEQTLEDLKTAITEVEASSAHWKPAVANLQKTDSLLKGWIQQMQRFQPNPPAINELRKAVRQLTAHSRSVKFHPAIQRAYLRFFRLRLFGAALWLLLVAQAIVLAFLVVIGMVLSAIRSVFDWLGWVGTIALILAITMSAGIVWVITNWDRIISLFG